MTDQGTLPSQQVLANTSSSLLPIAPGAPAQDGSGVSQTPSRPASPASPALSTASTFDGQEDIESSPVLPPLLAPRLPDRALELLRTPSPGVLEDSRFGTASWGSPYPQSDRNLRRQSFSSEASDDSPIHQLDIETPFLRPVPELSRSQSDPHTSLSAAAAVLANRVRRQTRGLTEDWIRTHTTDDLNDESRHWFSEGSESEHSSLSGSDLGWLDEGDVRTPRATQKLTIPSRPGSRHHPRARSSIETLRPGDSHSPKTGQNSSMATSEAAPAIHDAVSDRSQAASQEEPVAKMPVAESPKKRIPSSNGESALPATPMKGLQKPLPKEPAMTPRIKKKVPWKGKNIMVLLPRDEERGLPGNSPMPLKQAEIDRMFSSWQELGYDISGFDLEVEGFQVQGTSDSQTRNTWPSSEDLTEERTERNFKVTLPDLNAWKDYVNELQEAKLRALGVSFGDDEPAPPPSVSPAATELSRQPSAQYPPLPFSPPLPTSSASSNHAMPGFPFPGHFAPGRPATGSPAHGHGPSPSFGGFPTKYNPRQSISLPASSSPFGFHAQSPQGWNNPAGILHGMNRHDSPLANLNGMISPQSPHGLESPGANMHQRHQSLQYPMLPHQQFSFLQPARASPRLQEVLEDEEEVPSKSPSKTPEPVKQQNDEGLEAGIDDAQYHLEEQLRNELEHEDYNPQPQSKTPAALPEAFVPAHERQASNHYPVPERFANDPSEPLVLHHPRPHSRGHSLSQNFFRDHEPNAQANEASVSNFSSLNEIPETHKTDEAFEIETNPSNLGTPVQEFELSSSFGHNKNFSTASNPWNTSVSGESNGARRTSHGSKASISKLNVQAPEFKFNPANSFTPGQFNLNKEFTSGQFNTSSSFTPGQFNPTKEFVPGQFNPTYEFVPGQLDPTKEFNPTQSNPTKEFAPSTFNTAKEFAPGQFSFSGNSFQPAVFPVNPINTISSPPTIPPTHVTPAKINAAAPSFSPGQSDFSFSASGPKFNPGAPAFTPVTDSIASPLASGAESVGSRGSIFGSIDLTSTSASRGAKRSSKAVPIIRPVSRRSDESGGELPDGPDSRPVNESRIKRARSSAPGGDDVPLFAEQPKDSGYEVENNDLTKDDSQDRAADTSMSSIISTDHIDTNATTAAPSETSVADHQASQWKAFEFESKADMQNFDEARPTNDNRFKHGHKKTLSAAAQPFTPGAFSYGGITKGEQEASEVEPSDVSPVASPVPARPSSGLAASRLTSGQQQPRTVSKGLGASRFASPPPKAKGLSASRFAKSPTPEEKPLPPVPAEEDVMESVEVEPDFEANITNVADGGREQTYEEIDAVMDHFYDDPNIGVNKHVGATQWQHGSPTRNFSVAAVADSSPYRLDPVVNEFARDEASTTPREYHALRELAAQPMLSTELEDPFMDPPEAIAPENLDAVDGESLPASDWEAAFTEDEHDKLNNRAQFFDGRVNEVVGALLASRLEPLEKALFSIRSVLATQTRRTPSSRRDMRSVSTELQQSDADDEDEEPVVRRSMSPRRDRRLDQIRVAVMEGLAAHQRTQPAASPVPASTLVPAPEAAPSAILEALEDMKQQFSNNLRIGDDLKQAIQEAVRSSVPAADGELDPKTQELKAKLFDLKQRFYFEQSKVENEVAERRAAEDLAAELMRKLQAAETRVEVEIINRSVFDQRVADLEERLRTAEELSERSVQGRRAAEDKLTETRCLHEAAAEEVVRLRETIEHRDHKLRSIEQATNKHAMRMALLEAAQNNSVQAQTEATNKCSVMESELKDVRQDNHYWRSEAERVEESARQKGAELARALEDNRHMHKSLATLTTHLEENERLRESWRGKFVSLQDDMGRAARDVAEENAHRMKKEQAMLARQEVLDARLQAEAKTRERLEVEMERLQINERSGMRAINECTRLESIISELKAQNHKAEQAAMRYQREFEEARETGAIEVKRTRMALQTEIDSANNQVNVIREEYEEQNSKLRAELDNVRLEVDTVKAQNEMLLEEAENTKTTELEELRRRNQNEMEDLQTRYERQVHNAKEDAQKAEQNLLDRLSLSASKTEHLQDRILHLEDKLEIAKQAAAAAAQAAKSVGTDVSAVPVPTREAPHSLEHPERISPQALRESIMVLQEQLQAREQRIEELEANLSRTDPDAATKITKRDDEISWLRELLAVRHENLQDIIAALQSDRYNPEVVKDAAIRLKANLQMEEQERERAMNGGSAISLPNIAQSIQAATPRVAQTIGPIAAAWGNWRKGNRTQSSLGSFSGVLNSPAPRRNATPLRSNSTSQNSLLGGLMTPPASGLRQTPPVDDRPQPTAFASTGRRYPAQSGVPGRSPRGVSSTSHGSDRLGRETPPPKQPENEPMTPPPMMRSSVYDSDAQPGDFDDNDFFED